MFGLFPTGTRIRCADARTQQVIPELDSYLKLFDYVMIGTIQGCTLPVSRDNDYLREIPRLSRVVYSLGRVQPANEWRMKARDEFPNLDQRAASARAMELALAGDVPLGN